MNEEYLERVKFKDVFENFNVFDAEFELSGFKDAANLTETNTVLMYNLLYAKYCNSTVASIDTNRFKAQFFSLVFQYAPAWQKKLAIQSIIYAMDEDDVTVLNTTVFNTAQNPSTAPATDAFEALPKIDSQNATRSKRNALTGWAQLRDLVESDFTNEFVNKFKQLFNVIVESCELPPVLSVRGNKIYAGDTIPGVGLPYEHGDLFVKTDTKVVYQYDSVYGEPVWAEIVDISSSISPQTLLNNIEGSDYISVDLNEAGTKVVVELDETKLETDEAVEEEDKLITSGAVFNSLADKQDKLTDGQISNINRALVSPIATSTEKRIVAVNENNEQIQVKIGQNLSLSGDTSPYTLNASGGSGDSKLVEVTYNGINFNDFQALLNQGKIPYCNYSDRTYIYGQTTENAHYLFSSNISSSRSYLYRLACNNVGSTISWGTTSTSNETTSNKETTLTSTSTTKYPSSKAVADYVAQHSGGGWTLLWENASPDSIFSQQTLNINSSGYSKIAITIATGQTQIFDKGGSLIANTSGSLSYFSIDDGDSLDMYRRKITNITNSTIELNDGKHMIVDVDEITTTTANNSLKPYRIYGFN